MVDAPTPVRQHPECLADPSDRNQGSQGTVIEWSGGQLMEKPARSPLRTAARAAVTTALGLALVGAASTPALAAETGVITKRFGSGYELEET